MPTVASRSVIIIISSRRFSAACPPHHPHSSMRTTGPVLAGRVVVHHVRAISSGMAAGQLPRGFRGGGGRAVV
jgi:hypothetical protein